MARADISYRQLVTSVLENGYVYEDSTRGTNLRQISSAVVDFDVEKAFPLLTTKKMFWKGIVAELLWFLRGSSNIKFLLENDVDIWTKDALRYLKAQIEDTELTIEDFREKVLSGHLTGDVGRAYGPQWRFWTDPYDNEYGDVDQFRILIAGLQSENPITRRHIVTAWNPAEVSETALPPCHWSWEIIVRPLMQFQRIELYNEPLKNPSDWLKWDALDKKKRKENDEALDEADIPRHAFILKWNQRSVDLFLGLPFNIASYALLAKVIEAMTGLPALSIIGNLSNIHIYQDHIEAFRKQTANDPTRHPSPEFTFSENAKFLFSEFRSKNLTIHELFQALVVEDFVLEKYKSYGKISAEMIPPK